MPPLDALQQGVQSGSPSTTETTNATQFTQVLGRLLENVQSGGLDLVPAIDAITNAVTDSIIGGQTGTTSDRVLVSKGTGARALQPTVVSIDPATGDMDTNGGDLTVGDVTAAAITADSVSADTGAFTSSLTKGGNDVAVATQSVCCSWTFKYPEDETIYLIINSPFTWDIDATSTVTEVGTSTVTVSVNAGSLSSNSASTSQTTVSQSATVSLTGYVAVTFASTSSDCENLCLTIGGTRVLDS